MKDHSIKNGGPIEKKSQEENQAGKTPPHASSAKGPETKETTITGGGKSPDAGITARTIKFTQTGVNLLNILRVKYPEKTISGLVLEGLAMLLQKADAAPVVRYMRLAGKEIICLRAILAEAQKILESFREDILIARATPKMLADLADKTEAAIDKVGAIAEQVAHHSGFAIPSANEVEQIKGVIDNLEVQSECDLLDDEDREKIVCGIKYLKLHLPLEP